MLSREKPIEMSRRPWQRRIEVYSPKLKRRPTLFLWGAQNAWFLLEAKQHDDLRSGVYGST